MKRIAWLMLPWIVTVTVNPPCPIAMEKTADMDCGITAYSLEPSHVGCQGSREDCNWLYDMRDAFNDAHEQTEAQKEEPKGIVPEPVVDSSATYLPN